MGGTATHTCAMMQFVRRNEHLRSQVHVREYMGEISRVDGGGKMLRLSSDPERLHGYNPSLVIVDELHAWRKQHRKYYDTMVTGSASRPQPMQIEITTATAIET